MGTETPQAIDADRALAARLEAIRVEAAARMGIPGSAALPKIAMVAPRPPLHGAGRLALRGRPGRRDHARHLHGRLSSSLRAHGRDVSGGGGAGRRNAGPRVRGQCAAGDIRLGHPSGVLPIDAAVSSAGGARGRSASRSTERPAGSWKASRASREPPRRRAAGAVSATLAGPARRDTMDGFYRAVRAVGRFWLWVFFRSVDVRHPERVPAGGPVLLCINHPNNLHRLAAGRRRDRRERSTTSPRRRSSAIRLVARFLLACGAIPVYRRQDAHPDRMRPQPRGRSTRASPPSAMDGSSRSIPRARPTPRCACSASRPARRASRSATRPSGRTRAPAWFPSGSTSTRGNRSAGVSSSPSARSSPSPRTSTPTAPIRSKRSPRSPTRSSGGWRPRSSTSSASTRTGSSNAVQELYRDELVRELREARGLAERQIDLVRLSRAIVDSINLLQAARSRSGSSGSGSASRVTARCWPNTTSRTRRCARAAERRQPRRRLRLTLGGYSAAFPLFVYGAAVNVLPYWIPRWVARRMSRKETDYATWRFLTAMVALPLFWGLEILDRRAARRTRRRARLRRLPADLRAHRISLLGRRRTTPEPAALRRAGPDARARGPPAHDRAADADRRARAWPRATTSPRPGAAPFERSLARRDVDAGARRA